MRRIERGFARFERTLRVPAGMDPDAIQAELSDGVLTLRIPKPEAMRPRRIETKAGENGAREQGSQQGQQDSGQQPEQESSPAW